jgi:hypothetical protein
MVRRLLIVACLLLLSAPATWAQMPTADAMAAARSLVNTMKLADQYKALLPAILLNLKPALTQDRPEIERDYEAMMPMIADAFTPYYTSMVDGIAAVYAANFTTAELRDIEAFYRQPTGQKMLEKMPVVSQQALAVGQEIGRNGRRGPAPASHRGAASEGTQVVRRGRTRTAAASANPHRPSARAPVSACAAHAERGVRQAGADSATTSV